MEELLQLSAALDGAVWEHANHASIYPMHHHAELEMNLVVGGTATYLVKDRRLPMRPNTILWLFPKQEHLLLRQSPDYRMWIAVFKPRLVADIARDESSATLKEPDPAGVFCRQLGDKQAAALAALAAAAAAWTPRSIYFNAALPYFLARAWDVYQRADLIAGTHVHAAVEKAALLVRREQSAGKLSAIAKEAGLSPSRLSRLFFEQTGVHLVDYRQKVMLDRFLRIYGAGKRHTLSDAAGRAGFGSYAQFHRVFRRFRGESPAAYRARLRA